MRKNGESGHSSWVERSYFPMSINDNTRRRKVKIKRHVGVKQGCPFSPTLVGIFIDQLECLIGENGGGGWIANYALLFLIYSNDVVLLGKHKDSLLTHLDALNKFCSHYEMKANVKNKGNGNRYLK